MLDLAHPEDFFNNIAARQYRQRLLRATRRETLLNQKRWAEHFLAQLPSEPPEAEIEDTRRRVKRGTAHRRAYYSDELIDRADWATLVSLVEAMTADSDFELSIIDEEPPPDVLPPLLDRPTVTDLASLQAAQDELFANPEVAALAGTNGPAIGPGKYVFSAAEILRWLRRHTRRQQRVAPCFRRDRPETATPDRDEIRSTKVDEARGPPPGAERTRKGAGPTSCPPPSLSTTPRFYAGPPWPAIIPPSWTSLGMALWAVMLRFGAGAPP